MADVTVYGSVDSGFNQTGFRCGPFWKSTTVGYVILVSSSGIMSYTKTSDGGANWSAPTQIIAATVASVDCWADWQTAGDTGTKIHIACEDQNADVIRYVYLETATDTIAGSDAVEACQGSGAMAGSGLSTVQLSITKTRGGNIAIAARYKDSLAAAFNCFYTSPDGDTWTGKTSPWETSDDRLLLFPGNAADNNDLEALYDDLDADALSLKTFDNSANSWAEAAIGAITESTNFINFDGQVRLSDGHLILSFWNLNDNAAADLLVYDINGSGSITAKTNIITNEAESILVSVFVNQVNDDLYIAYCSGSAALATVACFYQVSTDDGGTWGGETAMQADAEDDMRWVSAGCLKSTLGGKFQPVWFDDDDNDIFCNSGNGIGIIPAAGGETYNQAVGGGSIAVATTLLKYTYTSRFGNATMTPSGVLSAGRAFARAMGEGAVAIAGTLSKGVGKTVGAGAVAIAGAFARGAMTFNRTFTATVTIAGTLTKTISKSFSGAVVPVGNLVKGFVFTLTAGEGSVAIAGAFSAIRVFTQAVGNGTVAIAGTFSRAMTWLKSVGSGAITPVGSLSNNPLLLRILHILSTFLEAMGITSRIATLLKLESESKHAHTITSSIATLKKLDDEGKEAMDITSKIEEK